MMWYNGPGSLFLQGLLAENDVDINALGVDGLTPLQTALQVCLFM